MKRTYAVNAKTPESFEFKTKKLQKKRKRSGAAQKDMISIVSSQVDIEAVLPINMHPRFHPPCLAAISNQILVLSNQNITAQELLEQVFPFINTHHIVELSFKGNALNGNHIALLVTFLKENNSLCTLAIEGSALSRIDTHIKQSIELCLLRNAERVRERQKITAALLPDLQKEIGPYILFGYLGLENNNGNADISDPLHAGINEIETKNTMIYLTTGRHPENDALKPLAVCLSANEALEMVRDLTVWQIKAINELYVRELTGELLRSFHGPDGFTYAHLDLLIRLMRNDKSLSVKSAIDFIQGFTTIQATECRFDRGESVDSYLL